MNVFYAGPLEDTTGNWRDWQVVLAWFWVNRKPHLVYAWSRRTA